MSRSFYRCWLPLSVVLHLALLAFLLLLPRSITPAIGETTEVVTMVPAPDATPPPSPHHSTSATVALSPHRPLPPSDRLGVAHPRTAHGTSASDMVDKRRGTGTGGRSAAPPRVATALMGQWAIAPGLDNGIGTEGTDPGEGGPSSGPAALGGPNPIYPKLAEERGEEGTVVVRVAVSAAGVVSSPVVVRSAGDSDLDNAAETAALQWRFTPAMKHGKPVSGTRMLRFHFANGAVTGADEGH